MNMKILMQCNGYPGTYWLKRNDIRNIAWRRKNILIAQLKQYFKLYNFLYQSKYCNYNKYENFKICACTKKECVNKIKKSYILEIRNTLDSKINN